MTKMGSEGSLWQTLAEHSASDDWQLVQRSINGEPLAQRTLIDRYLPLIFSVCRRRGLSLHDAEDTAQNIVVRVLQTLPQFRGDAKLSTWIFTVSQRAVADFYRHPNRREQVVDWSAADAQHLLSSATHDESHDERRDADKLTKLINAMSEPTRSILLHYYLADDSVADIALAMQLPEGTIKTHLFRGRQSLRQQLELS